ncbi:DSBA oxidoreductase [Dethiosulfatarculus sandiegensis]|uniref:DSBA oxidoreductase n=1 Tax=Dethiosulfatarculus sandiegensis TaxID=1429043 RepID=A0A0D2JT83_9BACT|nr:DSBA oxidoreductase [Dethiosulfatarculus sandiegensis]
MRREFDINVKYIFRFPSRDIPPEGLDMEEVLKGKDISVKDAMNTMKFQAETLKMPFGMHTMMYDSRLAQELSKWAEEKGKGHEFHAEVFRIYFVDGENISDMNVLAKLAETVGLAPEEAREVLENRTFKEAVDRDWEYSRDQRIMAIPTYKNKDRRMVGAKSYDSLASLVTPLKAGEKEMVFL